MDLCFASNNVHKLEEVSAILGPGFKLMSLEDIGCKVELSETQDTLEGNASQKASYVWHHHHIPCFADDTGLEVAALGGAPGVYSARFAGPQGSSIDNIQLLLSRLSGVTNRVAQFRSVMALILPQGEWLFEGIVSGKILESSKGTQGFGYDPVFMPEGYTKTLAEMTMDEKNAISHRAVALRKLVQFLTTLKGASNA